MATTYAIARRILLVLAIWALLTGGTVISCSSDPGNLGPGNKPPVAADSYYTVAVNGTLTGFMKATDPQGYPLTYAVVAGPTQGSLQNVDTNTGRFTYLPGTLGVDSFSFRASSKFQSSNTAVITIQVFDSTQGTAATKPSGVVQVADDPAIPGAVIVLWDDGQGTLQRIYRGLPVPAETLATGVSTFSTEPLSPGSVAVYLVDGTTVGGGTDTSRRASTPVGSSCLVPNDAYPDHDGGCPMVTSAMIGSLGADVAGDGGMAISLQRDDLRAGAWRLAVSGDRTVVLSTPDSGNTWAVSGTLDIGDLRLASCTEGSLCLIDGDGTHVWRIVTE